ncbi:hypothetical protein HYQ46_004371 [Verticillium longisporum]|nr:hypothetical protein HYQ46_004371 [Verticillium longisporum]
MRVQRLLTRKDQGTRALPDDGRENTGLAAETVWQGSAGDGHKEANDGDEDSQQSRADGEKVGKQRDGVHDDRVDTDQLLGKHDADDSNDGWPVEGILDDLEEAKVSSGCPAHREWCRVGVFRLGLSQKSLLLCAASFAVPALDFFGNVKIPKPGSQGRKAGRKTGPVR